MLISTYIIAGLSGSVNYYLNRLIRETSYIEKEERVMKSCTKYFGVKGFTLIELLVVIGIIAIIAAILFPVFAKVREKARQITCASNMRQLGLGFAEYTDDYDEHLPGAIDSGNGGAGYSGGWIFMNMGSPLTFNPAAGSIFPYVKSTQVYVCPDDSNGQASGDSYAVNSCTEELNPNGSDATQQPHHGRLLNAIDDPSSFMLLAEEDWTKDATGSTDDGILYYPVNFLSFRHTGGSNITFVDGHVKWYLPDAAVAQNLSTGGLGGPACPYP